MADLLIVDGFNFRLDKKTKFYLSSSPINGKRIRLHRYVWMKHNGPIPNGFEVHHKDKNRLNNAIDNLDLIPGKVHQKVHGELLSDLERTRIRDNMINLVIPKAKAWHKSEEGRSWHREHAKKVATKMQPREYICLQCKTEFQKKPFGTNKFCSNKCRAAWRRDQHIDDIEKVCVICGGNYFANKYQNTKTCSLVCKDLLSHLPRKTRS
jgi:hypothetical protein